MPQRSREHVRVVASVAALAALWLAACRLPSAALPAMFRREEGRFVPTAADCERCHQEVYREWRGSLHARAWTHPAFRSAAADGRAGECSGCHAAEPVAAGRAPALRDAHRDEGVTCVTCHLSPDPAAAPLTMRGPESRTSPVQVHPIVERDLLYRSSELCGTCHTGAYEEWQAAPVPPDGEKQTCQGCHMPPARRKMESVHDEHAYSALFVALGDARELRRHDFAVLDEPARELQLSVEPATGARALRVRVENRLPHALPTGRFGRREIRLVAAWPGGGLERSRVRSLGQALAAGGVWEEQLELPAGVAAERIALRLERWDHAAESWRVVAQHPAASPSGPP
jgi:nitrate/TMAO reductase-like tetraheme cytochrome c subunit